MTLGTHAIIGATLGALTAHPVGAFVVGITSHFLLDSIPHWDYKLNSFEEPEAGVSKLETKVHFNTSFLKDLIKIGFDILIGIAGAALIAYIATKQGTTLTGAFYSSTLLWSIALGAIGGMLPDPLQLAYYLFKREPLTSLQKFHMWIHTDTKLKGDRAPLGIASQILLVLIVITTYAFYH